MKTIVSAARITPTARQPRLTSLRTLLVASATLAAALSTAGAASAAMTGCDAAAINALRIDRLTVISATDVPAAAPNPEYCDVRGAVDTGNNQARFRIQLPANWNRKLLFYGVGGTGGSELAPSVNPVDSAAALTKGYATAITDTGHHATNAQASFDLTAPGSVQPARRHPCLSGARHA